MDVSKIWTAVASLLTIYVLQHVVLTARKSWKYKLPPMVPGIPFFGNSFQIPEKQQGPWAKQLAEKYGEM